ncbi:MAG: PQQ-dependent sugar dehydrogenase [Verrucomicrobiota bacterium]
MCSFRAITMRWMLACGFVFFTHIVSAQYPATPQIAKDGTVVWLEDYAMAPFSSRTLTGVTYSPTNPIIFSGQLSRINFLRSEPADAPLSASRFFACDLNRNLYIVDKTNALSTNAWTKYINFEEVFPKFDNDPGFAGGLATFQFDPEYATNGIFYTVHMETTSNASAMPTNGSLPGFNTNGYTTNATVNPPSGTVGRIAVLVEWRDTNLNNATFEGTARELMRVGFFGTIHPMGDLLFNPLARPGDADYHNLYICVGDGQAGEISGTTHTHPQRLDALMGKILRITPDTNAHPADALSDNGRYRIPSTGTDPNPFVSLTLSGVKKEIYAYGFRNPHRLSWDTASNKLLVDDIGLNSWEEVNIIYKGTNYGYAEREGIEQLFVGGSNNGLTGGRTSPVTPFPGTDTLVVTNGAGGATMSVTPTYPVASYSHRDGDGVSSGFVYRGTLVPQLYGKYVFGDITTARLFYCDMGELIAADDGNRLTQAAIHEMQVAYNSPFDSPDQGVTNRRLFDIVADTYTNRGGFVSGQRLPGGAAATTGNDPYGVPYGKGRADIRLAMDGEGELYVISKSDGMIRRIVGASPSIIRQITTSNNIATVTWGSIPGQKYRLEYKGNIDELSWSNVVPDVMASGTNASSTDIFGSSAQRFYRVRLVP